MQVSPTVKKQLSTTECTAYSGVKSTELFEIRSGRDHFTAPRARPCLASRSCLTASLLILHTTTAISPLCSNITPSLQTTSVCLSGIISCSPSTTLITRRWVLSCARTIQ